MEEVELKEVEKENLPPIIPLEAEHEHHNAEEHQHHEEEKAKLFQKMGQWESLDYQSVDNSLYMQQLEKVTPMQKKLQQAMLWVILLIIGILIGLFANFIHFCIHHLQDLKVNFVNTLLAQGKHSMGFLVALLWCSIFMVIASLMVTVLEPEASGAGIPEVKAYLNGVATKKTFNLRVLVIKVVGVILSVSSGIAAGYEGPMIHIGALIGDGISATESQTLKITSRFKAFRNDKNQRDFITSGASAGLAAAFTSPVGGTLFGLDELGTYWPPYLTWQTLFVCVSAVWTNSALSYVEKETVIPFPQQKISSYYLWELVPFALTGIFCGLLGCCFNLLNLKINSTRKIYYGSHPWYHKVVEVFLAACLTAFVQFAVPLFWGCDTISSTAPDNVVEAYSTFGCTDGHYNEMATLLFNTQHSTIVTFFSRGSEVAQAIGLHSMAIFFVIYFCLAAITSGLAVPSGLFFPFLILGGCSGRFVGKLVYNIVTRVSTDTVDPGVYAMVGTAAFITGSTRTTVSIGIILLELTDDITFLFPILLAIACAKNISDFIVGPIYDKNIELKQMPFVHPISNHTNPDDYRPITDIMAKPVVMMTEVERVGTIQKSLLTTKHNGFPVVTPQGNIKGLILRSQLMVLLNNHAIFEKDKQTNQYLEQEEGMTLHEVDNETANVLIDQDKAEEVLEQQPKITEKHKEKDEPTDFKSTLENIVQSTAFEKSIGADLTIESALLSEDEKHMCINLTPYMHASPFFVSHKFTIARAFDLFQTMAIRHLVVVDGENHVIGILTRKDFIAAMHH